MDFIERNLDEINQLLLHAEQDVENARNYFAQIRNRLLAIETTYNQLLRDYQDLQTAHNTINQLNANELTRRNQELAELQALFNDLTARQDALNAELNNIRINNEEFIIANVLLHLGPFVERLNGFRNAIQAFQNEFQVRNNLRAGVFNQILALGNNFAERVEEIRQRRNALIELENDRANLFNEQQIYHQRYEQYLEQRENLIVGNDGALNNLDAALNDALENHAENITRDIQTEINNLNNQIRLADRNNANIEHELENNNNELEEGERVLREIEQYPLAQNARWNDGFTFNFLLILFAGYILNLVFTLVFF